MAAVCNYPAKPEVYGLGIRIALYISWFGFFLLDWFAEKHLHSVRLLAFLLSAGAALGLIIQLAQDDLYPAEIYITLLLAAGYYIFLVPIYIWRAFTCCNPYWNPLYWSKEKRAPIYKWLDWALLVTLSGIGIWYYTTYLTELDDRIGCEQYGFCFGKVSLRNKVYIAFNAILYVLIAVVCTFILLGYLGMQTSVWGKPRRKKHEGHRFRLHFVRSVFYVATFSTLVTAIELTIFWNKLQGADGLGTPAQTIPLIVSSGVVIRAILKRLGPGPFDVSPVGSSSGSRGRLRETREVRETEIIEEVRTFPPPPRRPSPLP